MSAQIVQAAHGISSPRLAADIGFCGAGMDLNSDIDLWHGNRVQILDVRIVRLSVAAWRVPVRTTMQVERNAEKNPDIDGFANENVNQPKLSIPLDARG